MVSLLNIIDRSGLLHATYYTKALLLHKKEATETLREVYYDECQTVHACF